MSSPSSFAPGEGCDHLLAPRGEALQSSSTRPTRTLWPSPCPFGHPTLASPFHARSKSPLLDQHHGLGHAVWAKSVTEVPEGAVNDLIIQGQDDDGALPTWVAMAPQQEQLSHHLHPPAHMRKTTNLFSYLGWGEKKKSENINLKNIKF